MDKLYTSKEPLPYKNATKLANEFSKHKYTGESPTYYTAIKGPTLESDNNPAFCWYVTNKFDPRIANE